MYNDIPVDIMAAEDSPLGPTNKWFKVGFSDLWKVKIKAQEISILKAPCYLATKFEAFNNRGLDYRTSHDMEDIIYIIDNRINIVKEIEDSPILIKEFIKSELNKIIDKSLLNEILQAHIHPLVIKHRYDLIMKKIKDIISK